jgi:signal transduction histidine kinase
MSQRQTREITGRTTARAYLAAVLVTAAAVAARHFLFGVLVDDEPYMTFVIAVMVAAACGGLKSGLLATALGAVAGVYFFVTPYAGLRIGDAGEGLACALFVIAGVTISAICEALHGVRRRLEAKQSQLEQEVTDRQRAEAAARESAARLKEADRHKNEFLAVLAHELRNPLAPIRNAVRMLRECGPDAPELRWGQEVIERQVEWLVRLVDDLLDVSRISRGKVELRKERVALQAIVEGAVAASRPLIEGHGHELRVALPPGLIHLDADAVRLAQVLTNLLTNAAKYTEEGGCIWLTAGRQGGDVVVSVRDTGIGIAGDKLPDLFDMFFQVEHARGRSEGGLGIGLTLVRRLVELHGGTVEARSEGPGKGTEFVVRLPGADPAPPAYRTGGDRGTPA